MYYTSENKVRAKQIKVIICDVDGVLSDGKIIYNNSGDEIKHFNVKDGFIIKQLQEQGLIMGVITGRKSEVVIRRCDELNMDFHYHGIKDKVAVYNEIKEKYHISDAEVAYLGDDLPDLAVLLKCGLAIVPNDGNSYVKQKSHLVTNAKGGEGVLREAAEFILETQDLMKNIIAKFSE